VLCTACGATQDPGASTIATTAPDSTTSTLEDIVTTSVPDVEALAIADLASRLGVETGSISTIRSEAKTWPDGSLGCPEPGMSYTQALVEGWQILLEYQDRVYDYHAGGGEPFLCPSPDKDGGYDFVPPPGFDD
jgi:hypothetical protein